MPRIVSATAPKNVVIITLESMSSSYMAYGGNTQNLTPRLDRLATQGLMLGYLTTNQLVVLRPGRKIEDWRLNAQMEIVAPVRQPDPVVSRAIGAYQETARRARDGRLQHVNLSDGLRMR